jgi:uncharacterized membrane protein
VSARAAHLTACILLVALIFLGLAWELWLAPLRPGGSWLVLKVLPLLAPVLGMFRGNRYTFQWASLLVWAYFGEGMVRVVSDAWPSSTFAGIEAFLALSLFVAIVAYLRASRMA